MKIGLRRRVKPRVRRLQRRSSEEDNEARGTGAGMFVFCTVGNVESEGRIFFVSFPSIGGSCNSFCGFSLLSSL